MVIDESSDVRIIRQPACPDFCLSCVVVRDDRSEGHRINLPGHDDGEPGGTVPDEDISNPSEMFSSLETNMTGSITVPTHPSPAPSRSGSASW